MRAILAGSNKAATGRARLRIGALAVLTGATMAVATVAMAQVASSPPRGGGAAAAPVVTSWEINRYLEDSERASLEAAVMRASSAPIGNPVTWADSRTHASGSIRAVRDAAGDGASACREYEVTVDVPRRSTMVWTIDGPNNSNASRQVASQLSPAFTRQFSAEICRSSDGAFASVPTTAR